MKHRLIRLLVSSAAAALVLTSLPAAQAATTIVVDGDGFASSGDCDDAVTPAEVTIQDGVDAAVAGDTIEVCPGPYAESVTVSTPNLTILGAQSGVDARTRAVPLSQESRVNPPATLPGFSLQANRIVLDGFTVRNATDNAGISTSPLSDGYHVQNNIVTENTFGLYLHSAGDRKTIVRFNRFTDNNEAGSASGNGIYSDQGAQGILVRVNAFSDHLNGAVLFAFSGPSDNSDVIIENNRSTNDANFVNLFEASDFSILGNRTVDNLNADDGSQGSAIRVGGQSDGVLIEDNRLQNPAFSGVSVRDDGFGTGVSNIDIIANTVLNAEANGIDVSSAVPAVVQARGNTLRDNDVNGILFDAATSDNSIRRNTSLNNGDFDCRDASTGPHTAGTANFWRRNVGETASPDGICDLPA
ncbi:MAG: right-handed parallel beta-helix repeat-containing protein [Actinomycetota bacterium]